MIMFETDYHNYTQGEVAVGLIKQVIGVLMTQKRQEYMEYKKMMEILDEKRRRFGIDDHASRSIEKIANKLCGIF